MASPMVLTLSLLPTLLMAACSGAGGHDSGGNPLDGGILSVTPLEPFSPSGPEGGPFSPAEKTYTVSNIGATALGWEVEVSEGWLGLSDSSGTLSAGATIDLTLSVDPALAAILPDGMHTALLTFRGAGTGGTLWDQTAAVPVTLSIDFVFEGELAVYPPDPFQAFGPEGGPFLPNIKTYTLVNVGGEPLDWALTVSEAWASASGYSGTIGPGDFQTVMVTLTGAANDLVAGQHLGQMDFVNTTNGAGTTSLGLDLQVSDVPGGLLTVLPDEAFLASGQEGGPFMPTSKVYTLINIGGASLDWTAATSEPWASVSPTGGTIEPGQQFPVTVQLDPSATAALVPGDHTAVLTVLNATNGDGDATEGIILTVEDIPEGMLAVFPAEDFLSSGMEGGPFVPETKAYTLINIGGQALNWDASSAQAWVSFSPATGTLQPDEQVVVMLDLDTSSAAGFAPGEYLSQLAFTNMTNGAGDLNQNASLSVIDAGLPGSLRVFPLGPFDAQGFEGGPFSPSSQSYTLMNVGGQAIDWSVSSAQPWVQISGGSGTLGPADQAVVFLTLDQVHLSALPTGLEVSQISFANLTNGDGDAFRDVTVQIDSPPAPGMLSVTPAADFTATGFEGGPFTPDAKVYTLTNTGALALDWSTSSSVTWVTAFPSSGTLYPGQTQDVSFDLVSAQVNGLPSSVYTGLLFFVNTTDGSGGTSRDLSLTIDPPPTPGTLDVAPTGDFTSSGQEGGPFAPPSHTWILSNTGSQALDWQVTSTEAWVTLLPPSGQLQGGETISVVGTIDPAVANTLVAANYASQIDFTNLTNGAGNAQRSVFLTVEGPANPGNLVVTPASSFQASGPAGGPFAPDAMIYTLANTGGAALDWSAAPTAAWFSAQPLSGTLQPGGSADVVAALDSSDVDTFPAGVYSAAIDFVNETDGTGDSQRLVELTVDASGGGGGANPPVIPPGSGWTGPTSDPGQIGEGEGATAKVIATWDVVPFQSYTGDFQIGVTAFHINGIDRISFSLEGGSWVDAPAMVHNPRTGVWEYCGLLRASDFGTDRPVEVRAVAYPVVGKARVLPSLFLHARPSGQVGLSAYVSPGGDDSAGDGSSVNPYRTLVRASRAIQDQGASGTADGGVVYLLPGSHDLGTYSFSQEVSTLSTWLTITAAPGVARSDAVLASTSDMGLSTKLVHLENITIRTEMSSGGGFEDFLWLDSCDLIGNGPETNIGPAGWQSSTVWTGCFVTNCFISANRDGVVRAVLQRDVFIQDIGSDAFHGSQTVINCTVDGIDPGATGYHPDVIQFAGAGASLDNFVYYGVRAYNLQAQCIFSNGVDRVDNAAFVNLSFEHVGSTSQMSQWIVNESDHLLLWGITLHNQRFQFREGSLSNISVMGCCWFKIQSGSITLADDDFTSNHYVESTTFGAVTPGIDISVGDPLFTDPALHDYTPAAGSVLLGRVIAPPIPVDLSGDPRPAPCAVGAFE